MADGDHYSNAADIDNIYGLENVTRWSDADNENYRDDSRIDWANQQAKIMIDARMTDGPYDSQIPFGVRSSNNVPPMIQLMAATLAGVFLFDTRRVISSADSTDQISVQRKNYDRWIKQIMKGQLKLRDTTNAAIDKEGLNYPFSVTVDTD